MKIIPPFPEGMVGGAQNEYINKFRESLAKILNENFLFFLFRKKKLIVFIWLLNVNGGTQNCNDNCEDCRKTGTPCKQKNVNMISINTKQVK